MPNTFFSQRSLGLSAFMLLFAAAPLAAQIRPKSTQRIGTTAINQPLNTGVFLRFGKISQVSGLEATAQRATTGAASAPAAIEFSFPSTYQGQVKPGQPVWLTLDKTTARFTGFPISMGRLQTAVGRGPGKGKFLVTTDDVRLGPTGKIVGWVKVQSQDYLSGFTGVAWFELLDHDGNPLHQARIICRGVNPRSGSTERWDAQVPPEIAVQSKTIRVYHGQMGCGRDRFSEAMEDLKQAGEAAGEWVPVAAAVAGM